MRCASLAAFVRSGSALTTASSCEAASTKQSLAALRSPLRSAATAAWARAIARSRRFGYYAASADGLYRSEASILLDLRAVVSERFFWYFSTYGTYGTYGRLLGIAYTAVGIPQ